VNWGRLEGKHCLKDNDCGQSWKGRSLTKIEVNINKIDEIMKRWKGIFYIHIGIEE
jgi:hypothetical protein